MRDQNNSSSNSMEKLEQEYKRSLVKSGIKACNFIGEIIDSRNISDSQTKHLADVALKLIDSINSAEEIFDYYEDEEERDEERDNYNEF